VLTSQWFRIAERPPITDLRGGKASEDSFTRLMANLVVAYAVELQLDWFSDAALGSTGDFGWFLWPLPGTSGVRLSEIEWGFAGEKCD